MRGELLQEEGFEVRQVANGFAALETLREWCPKLVVLDRCESRRSARLLVGIPMGIRVFENSNSDGDLFARIAYG